MLDIGRTKVTVQVKTDKVDLVFCRDEESCPSTMTGSTPSPREFGVRNFENLTAGLREMQRTLKSAEKDILEFSKPPSR